MRGCGKGGDFRQIIFAAGKVMRIKMKFYISPSNQPNNDYVTGNTTEKEQMERVAAQVVTLLGEYDCEAILASLNLTISKTQRPKEARDKKADFYVAVHSNASGSKPPSKASGAVAFYHPSSAKAKALAAALVEELDAIAPVKSNRAENVIDGMKAFDGAGYGEIRSPMEYGIPTVLVETNFHDNPVTAEWLIKNTRAVAQAIVRAHVRVFGLKKAAAQPEKEAFPASARVSADSLNLRSGPGAEYEILTVVHKNDSVTLMERFSNGWYRVRTGSFDGYVNGIYLTDIAAQKDGAILFRVQAGAYKEKENALKQVEALKAQGFDAIIVPVDVLENVRKDGGVDEMTENLNSPKIAVVTVCGFLVAKLGALGPLLMVLAASLLGDYVTGLIKAGYQKQINSRVGLWGIIKKLLYLGVVAVAMGVDWLLVFLAGEMGLKIQVFSLFGVLVTVWLTVNEWISMLENITAVTGTENVPKFLMPVVRRLKAQVESKAAESEEQDKKE